MDARVSTPHALAVPFALGLLAGIVRGAAGPDHVAGLAHLVAIVPALALPGWLAPALYLAGYGLGCLIPLAALAGALGRVGNSERSLRLSRALASAASLGIGLAWIAHLA